MESLPISIFSACTCNGFILLLDKCRFSDDWTVISLGKAWQFTPEGPGIGTADPDMVNSFPSRNLKKEDYVGFLGPLPTLVGVCIVPLVLERFYDHNKRGAAFWDILLKRSLYGRPAYVWRQHIQNENHFCTSFIIICLIHYLMI